MKLLLKRAVLVAGK